MTVHRLAVAAMLVTLAACGGGSGLNLELVGGQEARNGLSGVVIDGPLQGARVCLDLNDDQRCNADEPVSDPSGADGTWQLAGLSAEQLALGARLIAMVPGDAIDRDNPGQPVGSPYELVASSLDNGVISPITTMIQVGVSAGLTTAQASVAVAAQTGVPVERLLEDYTKDPSDPINQNLADFASVSVVPNLQAGNNLLVQAPTNDAGQSYSVSSFRFSSGDDYFIRAVSVDGVYVDGLTQYRPQYFAMSGGQARDPSQFFSGEIFFDNRTGQWVSCDATRPGELSAGNPRRVIYCGTEFIQTIRQEDIGGTPIPVTFALLTAENSTLNWQVPDSLLANAEFVSGSRLLIRQTRRVRDSARYQPAAGPLGDSNEVTSVSELVAAFPLPAGNAVGVNTVPLTDIIDAQSGEIIGGLRVAFGPAAGALRYYNCNASLIRCTAIGDGGYQIETMGSAQVMRFQDIPAAIERDPLFIEHGASVWGGYERFEQALGESMQLNGTAFRALAGHIGLELPEALKELVIR